MMNRHAGCLHDGLTDRDRVETLAGGCGQGCINPVDLIEVEHGEPAQHRNMILQRLAGVGIDPAAVLFQRLVKDNPGAFLALAHLAAFLAGLFVGQPTRRREAAFLLRHPQHRDIDPLIKRPGTLVDRQRDFAATVPRAGPGRGASFQRRNNFVSDVRVQVATGCRLLGHVGYLQKNE